MMWKSARGGAALLCAALLASACGGGDQASTGAQDDKVTLSYGVWDATQQAVMQELAAEFTRTHPNTAINVQLTPWADYWTKLKAAVSAARRPTSSG
ncbi:extracellular solute-binding protein [Nonomuraea diastatica]|uniref:extracellular solute-binding protein n=1 Tax=Nonomuraea diastatica TaxID=1848329 RepID=UPI001409D8A9|nr:extracellular solute-binding protein [Nonomuraea diastatica]